MKEILKKNQAITLVSLVVTIIILIILAGVSINLTLGENGIITKSKQAKEKTEQAKLNEEVALNELYMQIEAEGISSGDASYDAIEKLVEFKREIADYIEEAGGIKPEYTADTISFGESIKGIVAKVTSLSTEEAATKEDIAEGKKAWVNGELILGTGANKVERFYFCTASESQNSVSVDTKISGLVHGENMFVYLTEMTLYSSGSNGWVSGEISSITVSGTVVTITITTTQAKRVGAFGGYVYVVQ